MASDLNANTIHKVTIALIGPTHPEGATHVDTKRFENLKVLTELVGMLISEIEDVSLNSNRHEASMKQAGEYAAKFLRDIREA